MDLDFADYPVILLPRKYSYLNIDSEKITNILINLNISSPDLGDDITCLYSGIGNIKLIDSYLIVVGPELECGNNLPSIITENHSCPKYTQSQVWIDPIITPQVENDYEENNSFESLQDINYDESNSLESLSTDSFNKLITYEENNLESYPVSLDNSNQHITVEQHNTYITQNVINYKATEDSSLNNDKNQQKNAEDNFDAIYDTYKDPEYEIEAEEAQSSDLSDAEAITRQELKDIGVENGTSALKQLMSTQVQKSSKQRKTISYSGQNSRRGQTIQSISIESPTHECVGNDDIQHEVVDEDYSTRRKTRSSSSKQKKYQCEKCKQLFDNLSEFRQHTVKKHKSYYGSESYQNSEVTFICDECGKSFKNQDKFEHHCSGHGDPELECPKCKKVFATKFTLRAHKKIHERKYPCEYCVRSYNTNDDLSKHMVKSHYIFTCQICPFTTMNYSSLVDHEDMHKSTQESDGIDNDDSTSNSTITRQQKDSVFEDNNIDAEIEQFIEADSILAQVMASKKFLMRSNKNKQDRRFNKVCQVCHKNFDRVADLKRHLIEHMVKSTLSKTPVSSDGTLSFLCEICKSETFTKIDKYKAHLREHARLTIYKCTFCDKSFSDSSNFSKHKKIHSVSFFQCDLCQRKFNTKPMLVRHMDQHKINSPMNCHICGKIFYFESMLNKHIKCTHDKYNYSKFNCRFCDSYFKSLKVKWDHEWYVHNVRKHVYDCSTCGSKFRKYSELKRHCHDTHSVVLKPAKELKEMNKY